MSDTKIPDEELGRDEDTGSSTQQKNPPFVEQECDDPDLDSDDGVCSRTVPMRGNRKSRFTLIPHPNDVTFTYRWSTAPNAVRFQVNLLHNPLSVQISDLTPRGARIEAPVKETGVNHVTPGEGAPAAECEGAPAAECEGAPAAAGEGALASEGGVAPAADTGGSASAALNLGQDEAAAICSSLMCPGQEPPVAVVDRIRTVLTGVPETAEGPTELRRIYEYEGDLVQGIKYYFWFSNCVGSSHIEEMLAKPQWSECDSKKCSAEHSVTVTDGDPPHVRGISANVNDHFSDKMFKSGSDDLFIEIPDPQMYPRKEVAKNPEPAAIYPRRKMAENLGAAVEQDMHDFSSSDVAQNSSQSHCEIVSDVDVEQSSSSSASDSGWTEDLKISRELDRIHSVFPAFMAPEHQSYDIHRIANHIYILFHIPLPRTSKPKTFCLICINEEIAWVNVIFLAQDACQLSEKDEVGRVLYRSPVPSTQPYDVSLPTVNGPVICVMFYSEDQYADLLKRLFSQNASFSTHSYEYFLFPCAFVETFTGFAAKIRRMRELVLLENRKASKRRRVKQKPRLLGRRKGSSEENQRPAPEAKRHKKPDMSNSSVASPSNAKEES